MAGLVGNGLQGSMPVFAAAAGAIFSIAVHAVHAPEKNVTVLHFASVVIRHGTLIFQLRADARRFGRG
ncbi:hypothetical protein [Geopsychrobacter electrodiphilus]|uniref:hypothetical protein n=1 Tax=Geopsychrobacter electrodiphilus TaxID=225196 RepID=UPI00146E6699|nr:hypothetical protein [Geopsychrobacter electrodiphilus]